MANYNNVRETLNGYATIILGENPTKAQMDAYNMWVANQRRGLARLVVKRGRGMSAVGADVVATLFNAYLAKCAKQGIDPSSRGKAGRHKKVVVNTENVKVTIEAAPNAEPSEVAAAVTSAVESVSEE